MERVKGIEPSSEAWEAQFGVLKSFNIFCYSFDFSVLIVRHGSGMFPMCRGSWTKLDTGLGRIEAD
jgi:hypothetical protein